MSLDAGSDVFKKISSFYRALCLCICLVCVFGLFGILAFGMRENLEGTLGASLIPIGILYICVPIVRSGYPPRFLMWTLEREEIELVRDESD